MKEPRWLIIDEILAFHTKQIREHGGSHGIRDKTLLESALARPQHLFAYASFESDIFLLAAAYAYGIAKNHPFVDGNKRTAMTSAGVFLILNEHTLEVPEIEMVANMTNLATGTLEEKDFGKWLKQGSHKISSRHNEKYH
jgi:death on curing protein